ncbi:hypothetical protein Tamer19_07890 [Cupriavidus sp. TA19]|uniref:hypothetical protein n=1 Tax=unclassified Cupriavidus TaxID=2640874 RepID=UPI000E2E8805|nr:MULTISPECIES: hypothetical protein [unclassified Cupriavidus]BDB23250.1 hypothetical protein CTP10_R05790 [Cupriavidus sp. P-10]GLC91381.1 hypothetical protein Tamer19_07890 [Cupriavidus sp. TA19]
MTKVIHVVITAVCGRWYATPVHDDHSAGGSTGFDSRQAAQRFCARVFPGVPISQGGMRAARRIVACPLVAGFGVKPQG